MPDDSPFGDLATSLDCLPGVLITVDGTCASHRSLSSPLNRGRQPWSKRKRHRARAVEGGADERARRLSRRQNLIKLFRVCQSDSFSMYSPSLRRALVSGTDAVPREGSVSRVFCKTTTGTTRRRVCFGVCVKLPDWLRTGRVLDRSIRVTEKHKVQVRKNNSRDDAESRRVRQRVR